MEQNNDTENRSFVGKKAGITGIICNCLLAVGKLAVGAMSASMSITADGINNLSDAASSVVTLVGFKLAERPADKEHPYGHARFEYLASLSVAVIILVIGVELAKGSIKKIIHPAPVEFSPLIAAVLVISILVKLWMMLFYKKIGNKINSAVLAASSDDSRNDVLTTSAVLAAALIEHFTSFKIDGIMGILVSVFILVSGFGLAKETLSPILGEGADSELRKLLSDYMATSTIVLGCHDLMVHDYGPGRRYATIHAEIDRNIDPLECHEEIDKLERECFKNYGIHLVIHYDPVITDDAEADELKSKITSMLKGKDERITIHDFRLLRVNGTARLGFDVALPIDSQEEKPELEKMLEEAFGKDYELNITYDMSTDY